MRGRFEGAVNVPAATLRQDVEVSTGSEDDDTPLVGAVVLKKHVGTMESLAVFFGEDQFSKGGRCSRSGIQSPPCSLSNLLEGVLARESIHGV